MAVVELQAALADGGHDRPVVHAIDAYNRGRSKLFQVTAQAGTVSVEGDIARIGQGSPNGDLQRGIALELFLGTP